MNEYELAQALRLATPNRITSTTNGGEVQPGGADSILFESLKESQPKLYPETDPYYIELMRKKLEEYNRGW